MNTVDVPADAKAGGEPLAARRQGWLAAGGVIGAILASSCCIVPLLLVTVGVSGAWIGTLTALKPYSPYIGVATLVVLGIAFRQVYFRPAAAVCEAGSYCARPGAGRVTKIALWLATLLVAAALSVNLWAPLFY